MLRLLCLIIFIPLPCFGDQYQHYFDRSIEQLTGDGFTTSVSTNGSRTLTRNRGADKQTRILAPGYAIISDDMTSQHRSLTHYIRNANGTQQSKTLCRSVGTSNSDRDKFRCLTVNSRYCTELLSITESYLGTDVGGKINKIKECNDILKNINGRVRRYLSLQSGHEMSVRRLQSSFNISSENINNENGATHVSLENIVRNHESCKSEKGKWGSFSDGITQPTNAGSVD